MTYGEKYVCALCFSVFVTAELLEWHCSEKHQGELWGV
jgi:hypothetical protein